MSAKSLKAAKRARILCFPRAESFDARVFLSHFIHIDKPRYIEVELSSGWNDIKTADIRLKAASAGLRLRTANASTTSGDVSIEDKSSPGVITLGTMAANTTAILQIPYDMETILQDLTIKIEIDYNTENGKFQYMSSFTIPVDLPLDVNVHDHFKSKSLFSKFNIKTASNVPLTLLDVSLEGSEEFEVQAPRRSKEPVHVFPKQPVAVTYKITKKAISAAGKRQSRISTAGSLSLSVEYRCLDEDVLDRLRKLFAEAVEASPVHRLARLLTDTFADQLAHTILPHQFERIALLGKVSLGAFEETNWSDCLESLPLVIRDDTRSWLQKWHEVRSLHMACKLLIDPCSTETQNHIDHRRYWQRYDQYSNSTTITPRITTHGHYCIHPTDTHPQHCISVTNFHNFNNTLDNHRHSRPTPPHDPPHLPHPPLGLPHQPRLSRQPLYPLRRYRLRLHHRRPPRDMASRRPTPCTLLRHRRRGAREACHAGPSQARQRTSTQHRDPSEDQVQRGRSGQARLGTRDAELRDGLFELWRECGGGAGCEE